MPIKCEKTRKFALEKYIFSSYVTSEGSENYQKIFFEEFLSFPKLKKIMRIGLLQKHLEGGVEIHTPPCPETVGKTARTKTGEGNKRKNAGYELKMLHIFKKNL